MKAPQSPRAARIRAARQTDTARCPEHGARPAGIPRRYGDPYRFTCGCPTGATRGGSTAPAPAPAPATGATP